VGHAGAPARRAYGSERARPYRVDPFERGANETSLGNRELHPARKETKMKLFFSRSALYRSRKSPMRAFMAMLGVLLLAAGLPLQAAKDGKPGGGGGGGGGGTAGNPAIAYIVDFDGWSGSGSLVVMDAFGQNQQVVLGQTRKSYSQYPVWHPNGQQIIFTYWPDTNKKHGGIYRINLDGSGLTAIIPPEAKKGSIDIGGPTYIGTDVSPVPGSNGKYRIAYAKWWMNNGGSQGIFVIDEDGSGQPVQIAPALSSAQSPSWSPDGAHLAYTLYPEDASGHRIRQLHLVTLSENADGTVRVEEDRIVLDSEEFGEVESFFNVTFSRTRNTIYFSYFSSVNTIWALHLDEDMNRIGDPELLTITSLAGGIQGLSGSADDTAIVFAGRNNSDVVPSIFLTGTDGSGDVLQISNNGSYPSFKR
jgi:hypothetical protein